MLFHFNECFYIFIIPKNSIFHVIWFCLCFCKESCDDLHICVKLLHKLYSFCQHYYKREKYNDLYVYFPHNCVRRNVLAFQLQTVSILSEFFNKVMVKIATATDN